MKYWIYLSDAKSFLLDIDRNVIKFPSFEAAEKYAVDNSLKNYHIVNL